MNNMVTTVDNTIAYLKFANTAEHKHSHEKRNM